MVTFSEYTGGPGSGAYVPTLPYTKNGNNVESFLAPLSFWPGMVIYGGVIRDAAGNPVVPAAHISGSDLRNYRRVRTDIKIIDPANPAP
jgi:hypothetical protein